jgi:hypothetical protein
LPSILQPACRREPDNGSRVHRRDLIRRHCYRAVALTNAPSRLRNQTQSTTSGDPRRSRSTTALTVTGAAPEERWRSRIRVLYLIDTEHDLRAIRLCLREPPIQFRAEVLPAGAYPSNHNMMSTRFVRRRRPEKRARWVSAGLETGSAVVRNTHKLRRTNDGRKFQKRLQTSSRFTPPDQGSKQWALR